MEEIEDRSHRSDRLMVMKCVSVRTCTSAYTVQVYSSIHFSTVAQVKKIVFRNVNIEMFY